jgi:cytochrome c
MDIINSRAKRGSAGALVLLLGLAASAACESSITKEAEAQTGGRVRLGPAAIGKYGCAACHTIPRIDGVDATVGPRLDHIAVRPSLGGRLPNTPGNMIKWIQHPQSVDPKNVMPDLGVTDQDAKDIVAFLYTLR